MYCFSISNKNCTQNVQKKTFSENYLNILLLYRSHNVSVEIFLRELSVTLTNNNDVDIVLGDFNMDSSNSNLMQVMNGFTEIVDHPTHIDGEIWIMFIFEILLRTNLVLNAF